MNTYERLGRAIAKIYFPEATMSTPDTTIDSDTLIGDDVDEFTRNRIDRGGEPDYRIVLDIMGYRKGMEEKVRWVIEPVSFVGIDPQDNELISAILERVAEVYSSHEQPRKELEK